MTTVKLGQIDHPSAWRASDFSSADDYAFDLTDRHLDAFAKAIAEVHADGVGLQELTSKHFTMPEIADDLASIRSEIMDGRGMIVMRGFPVDDYSLDEISMIYWGIGTHFGRGVSQSPMGDRLGYVTDVSKPGTQERGYRSAKELRLHTDSDDIVGLLCIRQSKSGGLSRLASAVAIHNEIAATRPDLLEPLYNGFHYHWFGEQPPGEPAITDYRVPVFSWVGDQMSMCYLRDFINMAADDSGEPLSDQEVEALNLFESTAMREDLMLEFRHEPHNAFFINNYTTLHSRTEFEDWPELDRRRLLLRLWLKGEPSRAVHPILRRYYGDDGMHIDGRTDTIYDPEKAMTR
ncbi:MAG: TauD/TfdA family dioxygenase [Rhodospirillales bacterium]|jgi:hypothetical protein|nr:TauD/TfdA family dioxygenase [Rhodospirillales bacterium]MBT4040332.1 TauD/TfdA family dioxygenase [Rhodospirillales bacterium]MBT4625059.1 TauD/TfdA family dioxygenase [Rhodospirillales bacterium]MBT5353188.1 TauD/TfdA family dioxygenase [Rhodospirillales bacterium]MBT5519390.1 TauD/TfdA family dioxygenase [Rhodospirillales bacterium]